LAFIACAKQESGPVLAPSTPPLVADGRSNQKVEQQGLNALGYVSHQQPAPVPGELAPPEMNTEEYGRFEENPFLRPADNPLSTFSIDVDRASYANVRRFLRDGVRPPRDAVRIEEMVNYFTYSYPEPTDGEPVSITTELAACPWNAKNRLLLIGLQTKKIETRDLPPNNLVFLVDTSGSMSRPTSCRW
jgi:Ca-activated chloride channel family protein